jgi:murein DD-endopeptidase MepM/ murein hydrolase activator NlpD
VALPALGAAVSKARALQALASALGGSAKGERGPGKGCCISSCFGCVACVLVIAVVAISLAGALVAGTAALAGVGGVTVCATEGKTPCAMLTGAEIGAPMNCPGLYVSQGFGDTPWEHPHTGIDIVCPQATVVVAVTTGVFHQMHGPHIACAFPAGHSGGLGTYGALDAGGVTYLYGHLEAFAADDGEKVIAGQPIGFEGATGCATGSHLHFEVEEKGKPVNPCPMFPEGYPNQHDSIGLRCWGTALP